MHIVNFERTLRFGFWLIISWRKIIYQDSVIRWTHFLHYWPPVTSEFPHKGHVMRSFEVSFDVSMSKLLNNSTAGDAMVLMWCQCGNVSQDTDVWWYIMDDNGCDLIGIERNHMWCPYRIRLNKVSCKKTRQRIEAVYLPHRASCMSFCIN